MKQTSAPFHDTRNAFHWHGKPSIFSTVRQESIRQIVDKAVRENNESSLSYVAGHSLRVARDSK